MHVRLGSWLSTSSVPTTYEFFSGLQPLQNIFIVPTDPARRKATRESGGAGWSVARARSAPSGRRAGRECFPEAPATRSRRSSRSPARRRAPPTTSVRPSVAACRRPLEVRWSTAAPANRQRAAGPAARPPARVVTTARRPVAARLSPAEGGRKGGSRQTRRGRGAAVAQAARSSAARVYCCVAACSRPGRPSPRAARASERPEESMVQNLAAD